MLVIGYTYYIVLLFIVTGFLILRFDAKIYQLAKMEKERRAARFLGWTNLSLGIAALLANWIFMAIQ